jgi:hypothetical protein
MDDFLAALVADLKPVRPRRPYLEALLFAALCGGELILWLASGQARPDLLHAAETTPAFWWKLASFGLLALLGAGTAISALDPVASPRRGLLAIGAVFAAYLVMGGLINSHANHLSLMQRLNWREGLQCLTHMVLLSAPVTAGLALLVGNGATTDPEGTTLACGVASGAWAAFVFTFACTHDDPLYVIAWYTLSGGLCAGLAQVSLAFIARW